MINDLTTCQMLNENIQLLKNSDWENFSKSLSDLLSQGYSISVVNMTLKTVPRIGKVITYFAELREEIIPPSAASALQVYNRLR